MLNQNYFGDSEIERMLKLGRGVIGKLTSSFLVSYKHPDSGEKLVIDIGLNVKNMQKKAHVAKFVRFVAGSDQSVAN